MSEEAGTRLLRAESSSQRATFLELFLDLVFVFALTRVSQRLVTDFTTDRQILLPEAGQTLLLFLALWLVWSTTAYATSRLEPELPPIQFVVVMTMVGSMVMAVALPRGFAERGMVFAAAYVSVQFGRALFLFLLGRATAERTAGLRVLIWTGLTAMPWLVGGLLPEGPARGLLWTAAVALDYGAIVLGWRVPGLGRQRIAGQRIAAEHLAERYQQFLLIALGEAILVIGFTFSGEGFAAEGTAGFVVALTTTVLLWRIYFYRAGHVLPLAIASARQPARLGSTAGVTHLFMIAGIVLTGVGYELYIVHPFRQPVPPWLIAILGGPALFLAGRALFEFQVFARVSWSRIGGLLALGALAPAMLRVPPLAVGVTAAALLLVVAASDARRSRKRPLERPTPRA